MKAWFNKSLDYLETHRGIPSYLWQHNIWEHEMVPDIARNGWGDRLILRNPFGIMACPSYAPFECGHDKSEAPLALPETRIPQPMIKLTGYESDFAEPALREGRFVNGSLLHQLVCPTAVGHLEPPDELWYWLRCENGDIRIYGNGNAAMVSTKYRYRFSKGATKTAIVLNYRTGVRQGPSVRQFCLAVRGPAPPPDEKVKKWVACYVGDPDGPLSTHGLFWRPCGYWRKGRKAPRCASLWRGCVEPDETWAPVISPVDGTLVPGWFASSCGAIMGPDGAIDRRTPCTGDKMGMFSMKFPFGVKYVHAVTETAFHGFKDPALWVVDHINTRRLHPDEQYPGREENLQRLPIHKKLAALLGLPTNQARKAGEPWPYDQFQQAAAEKNGIPYWVRQVGTTDGWTKVRSQRVLYFFFTGRGYGKAIRWWTRRLYEVVERCNLGPFTPLPRGVPGTSVVRECDSVRFNVTLDEPSSVVGEYEPDIDAYHRAWEEPPRPTRPMLPTVVGGTKGALPEQRPRPAPRPRPTPRTVVPLPGQSIDEAFEEAELRYVEDFPEEFAGSDDEAPATAPEVSLEAIIRAAEQERGELFTDPSPPPVIRGHLEDDASSNDDEAGVEADVALPTWDAIEGKWIHPSPTALRRKPSEKRKRRPSESSSAGRGASRGGGAAGRGGRGRGRGSRGGGTQRASGSFVAPANARAGSRNRMTLLMPESLDTAHAARTLLEAGPSPQDAAAAAWFLLEAAGSGNFGSLPRRPMYLVPKDATTRETSLREKSAPPVAETGLKRVAWQAVGATTTCFFFEGPAVGPAAGAGVMRRNCRMAGVAAVCYNLVRFDQAGARLEYVDARFTLIRAGPDSRDYHIRVAGRSLSDVRDFK